MYKLVAFDAYGTLFDVFSMGQLVENYYAVSGQAFALMWRDRQIEYTRLITMSDPNPLGSKYYLPFWEITLRSLRYVCKRFNLELTNDIELNLMRHYEQLASFEDSLSVLKVLVEKKHQYSNSFKW